MPSKELALGEYRLSLPLFLLFLLFLFWPLLPALNGPGLS